MVKSTLNYLAEMSERPFYYLYEPPAGTQLRNTTGDRRTVPIHDARDLEPEPSLEREGFALARHETAVENLYHETTIRGAYYPEIEELVKRATGAVRVLAFDHNVRSATRAEQGEQGIQHPVKLVHNDYTEGSGPQRVRDLLDADEAEARLKNRFAVINVWKPLGGPVQESPLAVCDAQSIRPQDLKGTDLRYRDRTGEIYTLAFNADHRWFYYSNMGTDEAMLLKCFDSDSGRARFTAHTAFEDPTSPKDARPRESIEVRTLAFFDA
ncbi:MAG: methyltransferase [Myxococcales bacterium]|nr:methyltransferase [Myxococcales bacterium]TDI97881.1 MAG: methyltransferase [Deltaproteobacteria bacterium]TDJ05589.1 MAG: methyltransferase [Deltaproteobacteria bacterium]